MIRTITLASRCSSWTANSATPTTIRITPGSPPRPTPMRKASPVWVRAQVGIGAPLYGGCLPGERGLRSSQGSMVTWEMPDGTEFRSLGIGVSDAALREFVLRFMSSDAMSWDASSWDDRLLERAFLQRFGEPIKVLRERSAGHTILVFKPVMSGA